MNTVPSIPNSCCPPHPQQDSRGRASSPQMCERDHGFNSGIDRRACKSVSHARLTMMPRDEQKQMVAIVCAVIAICIFANTLPMVLR